MKPQECFIRRRLGIVAGLLTLCFVLLGVRAADLQIIQSEELKQRAEKQRQRQLEVQAPRGQITDTKGRILAESIEVPSIYAIGSELQRDRLPEVARILKVRTSTLRKTRSEKIRICLAGPAGKSGSSGKYHGFKCSGGSPGARVA